MSGGSNGSGGIMPYIMGGLKTVAGLGSEIFAPGNPIGISLAGSGVGQLAGEGAGGNAGASAGSSLGSLFGGLGSGLSGLGSGALGLLGFGGGGGGSQAMDAGTGLVGASGNTPMPSTPGTLGETNIPGGTTPFTPSPGLMDTLAKYGVTPGNSLMALGMVGNMAQQRNAGLRAYQNSLMQRPGPMGGPRMNTASAFAPANPIQRQLLPLLAALGFQG